MKVRVSLLGAVVRTVSHPGLPVAAALALVGALLPGTALADPPAQQLGEIVVIGVTPLPGLDLPPGQVPANVQSAQSDDVQQINGQSLTDLLQRNFQGVHVTQSQANPWQANLYFHGFTLSPLLGAPSGMSIYVDGVRQNESFAETMNWESLPDFAIRDVELIPGSNPLYGRNTLGGALVLTTKSGFSDPGGAVDVTGGSWGRIQEDADYGWHNQTFGLYAGVANSYETGWRDYSPSRVQQAFVRGDWRPDDATNIALSYTGAHAVLHGTQSLPVEWADTPKVGFTWPDSFVNNLSQFNLTGSRQMTTDWSLQASAYLRLSKSRAFNSNTNDFDEYDAGEDGPLGYAPGGPFDPDSLGQFYYAGLTPAYDPLDPAATINNVPASNILSHVQTRGYGGSIQTVNTEDWWAHANQFTAGLSLDAGTTTFTQLGQPAYFPYTTALRGDAVGMLSFNLDPMTLAGTSVRNYGIYFVDVLALTGSVHVTLGGRYDYSQLAVRDLSGQAPDIDGRQTFHRFNPSAGVTWAIKPALGAYVNYDEGMRTPTPIEIECADPEAPCSLPNDFTGDPPLQAVVAHTVSGGLRGTFAGGHLHWNVSPYYSRVDNDILTIFTGSAGNGEGYFANVPRTLRKGVDMGIGGLLGKFEWQANYSYVNATYGAPFEEAASDNSSAGADGVIRVASGDRIPGIPRNLVTLAGEFRISRQWSFGGNLRAYSNQYAVGDENNRDKHGPVAGYAVVDFDLHYQPTRALSLFARVDNVFNRHYFAAGQLSRNVFDTPNRLLDTTGPGTSALFVVPGSPRAWFVGVRYEFGKQER